MIWRQWSKTEIFQKKITQSSVQYYGPQIWKQFISKNKDVNNQIVYLETDIKDKSLLINKLHFYLFYLQIFN